VFELDFVYSTVREDLILSCVGIAAQVVGWCLDSPRDVGVSMGFLVWHLSLCSSESISMGGAFFPVDLRVEMVHCLSMYGIPQWSLGPIQGVWVLLVV
jgi:hypothetical protein